MNFEVFQTFSELNKRMTELTDIATQMISDHNGIVYTLKWC